MRARSALVGAAVSLIAALGFAGSARAAVYTGNWDPDFGGSFVGLGWKGEATFFIPDACLLSSGLISNANACSGGGMQVLDAEVTFYETANPLNIYETLTFTPLPTSVLGMYVTGGQLTGVNSNFLGPVQSTDVDNPGYLKFFDLVFQGAQVALYYTSDIALNPGTCAAGPLALPGCGVSVNIPALEITPVPEPATYALMLAGLGALGLASRRRRR